MFKKIIVCLLIAIMSITVLPQMNMEHAQAKSKKLTIKETGFWKTNNGKVIKKAKSKLHSKYVWGASGPNRFDCSGFVSYIMKKSGKKTTGVKFQRTSAQGIYNNYKKYNIGKSLKKARPADIVFLGDSGSKHNIYHVGIYYHNGKYIHAANPRKGVIISKIPKTQVAGIIRLPGLKC